MRARGTFVRQRVLERCGPARSGASSTRRPTSVSPSPAVVASMPFALGNVTGTTTDVRSRRGCPAHFSNRHVARQGAALRREVELRRRHDVVDDADRAHSGAESAICAPAPPSRPTRHARRGDPKRFHSSRRRRDVLPVSVHQVRRARERPHVTLEDRRSPRLPAQDVAAPSIRRRASVGRPGRRPAVAGRAGTARSGRRRSPRDDRGHRQR